DLSIYFQHVIFHTLPLFWRFHRVHHCDLECDVTTGVRFHPIEILLSMLVKFMTIAALGAPVLAVFLFEVSLNFMSMFTHANINLPKSLEKILSPIIVTPRMHFIHHSTVEHHTNSNFGFNISLWDRMFGTFVMRKDHELKEMDIGLSHYRDIKKQSLRWLLYLPFVDSVRHYAINMRNHDQDK
ncbi:MAG: sterol desaturase family protein, partial [Methylococcales bacterium]|nr:sterol desaturase family protein [Methylococcales bacterium]